MGSILDYAVEEDLEKSDAVEMEMDSCSSGTGSSSTVIFISVCIIEKIGFPDIFPVFSTGFFDGIFRKIFSKIDISGTKLKTLKKIFQKAKLLILQR